MVFTTQNYLFIFLLMQAYFYMYYFTAASDFVYFTHIRLVYKIHINTTSGILWKNCNFIVYYYCILFFSNFLRIKWRQTFYYITRWFQEKLEGIPLNLSSKA